MNARISLSGIEFHFDVLGPKNRLHEVSVAVHSRTICMWCMACNVCSEGYDFDPERPTAWAWRGRTASEMPHLDEVFRAVAEHQVANRTNLIGVQLRPAAQALDSVIAARDGSSVYFAQADDRIKIGWSKQVSARLASLQTGCPSPIRLLGTIPGSRAVERRLHEQFASLRLSGEWFRAAPELLAHIAAVAK